jgi:predicted dehydrogenase
MFDLSRREFVASSAGALAAMAILPDLSRAATILAGPVNVALVGCGRQGRAIIAELAKIENVKLLAVCDIDQARSEAAGKRAQGAQSFTDIKAMLDKVKDIAAVIIATPTHLHKEPVLAAIAAGKHVYCEAPMAHTVADAKAIATAAAGTKTIVAVGFEGRSNPVYKLARSFFRSDAVREAIAIESKQFQKTTWRFPGNDPAREAAANWRLDKAVSLGLPGEWGSHAFDVGMWYTDRIPQKVRGFGAIRLHADGRTVADTVHCDLIFAEGLRMQFDGSLGNSYEGRYELFRGANAAIKLGWTHGWMFKEADAPTQGWEVYANRQQFHNDEGITLIADATKLASQGKLKDGVGLPYSSLYYALSDFVGAVDAGKAAACDAAAGLRSTVIAIAAAQATAENSEIAINPADLKI